jgi:hypothetical protein
MLGVVLLGYLQSETSLRTELDTNRLTVGDRIQLTITVEHPAGTEVIWPDTIDVSPFEVLGAEILQPVQVGGRMSTVARFGLTAFELGELELPAFEVSVQGPVGVHTEVLRTESKTVSVITVGLDESGDIRAIKGPMDIPRNWLLLLPWFAVIGAMAATTYWVYRRRKARGFRGDTAADELLSIPPHEIAYDALARLDRSGMLERGEVKEYFIVVSDIIRRYVEGRYRVDALEMASYEVIIGLERAGVALELRLGFERFLGDCDFVKFAKWIPEMTACREMVPRARKIVDDTKQLVPTADPEDGAGGATPVMLGREGSGGQK